MPPIPEHRLIKRLAWLTAAFWTFIIVASLVWNLRHDEQQAMGLAYAEATANINKDLALRRWASEHGGVYVPITEKQQSVPWLNHVPGRDVTTTDGRRLTLLNPASVLRQTMDRYAQDYGIRGRITGLKALNPDNLPDAWEKERLVTFTRGDTKEAWAVADIDGQPYLRYLRAMFMEPGCDKCHAILGYNLGDMRGATGINLPLAPYYERIEKARLHLGLTHGLIWLLGLAGIGGASWSALQRQSQRLIEETKRASAEEQIRNLAFYDPLTLLPNRRLLQDRMQQSLVNSVRNGCYGALILLDLDDFKTLNDTLGHEVGDQLLVAVAQRLQECVREGDTVARQGGDEFVVILEGLTADALAAMQVENVAVKIQRRLNEPYLLDLSAGEVQDTHDYHCTSSIGITLFQDNSVSIDELLKRADTAMYQAKAAGRNAIRFFDPVMQATVTARAALDNDLRVAVLENQFLLYYQPQVDDLGHVTGAEALARWQHPQRGMVSPAEFIPAAEQSGVILQLGHWVLETACVQLVVWAAEPDTAHLTLAVNVSARQFRHRDFVDRVMAVLDHTGANPRRLKLELTESLLLEDVEDVIAKMTALKNAGVGFSLDDFGTGYSSLSYLKRLPFDQLKIDQSFVRDVLTDPNDSAIARTIVALANSMGLSVIAEGVETDAQRKFLAANGCGAFQGYYFGRPVPIAEFSLALAPDLLSPPQTTV